LIPHFIEMKTSNVLHFPDKFLDTCELLHVMPIKSLEFFLSKCTLHTNLIQPSGVENILAAKVFEIFLQTRGENFDRISEFVRLVSVEHVKRILKVFMTIPKASERFREYEKIVNEWYAEIEVNLPSKSLITSINTSLALTKDFSLLCQVLRTKPIDVLQFYVNHVSIDDFMGVKENEENEYSFPTGFFLQHPSIVHRGEHN
jgi:hypothetical protein